MQVIQVLSWAGKNEEALRLTEKAEAVHPGLSDVPSYRGRLLEKQGKIEEALRSYEEAVRRNPRDSLALSRAGWTSLRLEQYVHARAYFATSVVNMPVQAPVRFKAATRFGCGLAFLHLEQWADAQLEFEAALRLAPDHAEAQEQLERVLAHLKLQGAASNLATPTSPRP